jgi:hypothetical protein
MATYWEQQHQWEEDVDYLGKPKGGKGGMRRKGAPPTKGGGAAWVETRKCHWCDLPGHLVRDCPAKRDGKPQKPGLQRKGGRKGGGRGAGSLDEDYEESMLGRELDGGSLEWECGSLSFDCSDCASGYVCGICGGEEVPDFCDDTFICDRTSQEDAAHLPDEGRVSRNVSIENKEYEVFMLEGFDMSVPGGDYEVEHTVDVAPLIVDAEGWPTEGPPGLLATSDGWTAQGVGARPAQPAPAQPAQVAPQTLHDTFSHAPTHAQTSAFPLFVLIIKQVQIYFLDRH